MTNKYAMHIKTNMVHVFGSEKAREERTGVSFDNPSNGEWRVLWAHDANRLISRHTMHTHPVAKMMTEYLYAHPECFHGDARTNGRGRRS